ncbi:ABC transporter substrate-binding protein [Natrinema saccharevitans]|uniref:ABC transporter substrate-binding protein n=1 Tax=Natrinema saccharevitans TaxID=301967 RepID=A0A1S8AY13_9EURY|nr:ABC transporter substrate-binding protein [Natrinema saccharevitans]OLZ41441.1 ABC transporter substrate-binding protein [Natrinema saccharevitans]
MNGGPAAPNRTGPSDGGSSISRRSALAAAAGLTVSTSGCIRQARDILVPNNIQQLSLTITTLPADSDRQSIRLSRELADVFGTVGIDVSFDIRSPVDFRRTVLYDHEFDVWIAEHPGGTDPDFLYEALHSVYTDESGWQNPFGYTNLTVDDSLETQRQLEGEKRREAVTDVLEQVAIEQPFVPICIPDQHRAVRTDRFDWDERALATPQGYLGIDPAPDVSTLRATHTDSRPTSNLNPLAVDYRGEDPFVDLLYDSLATETADGEIEPWFARSWEWDAGTIDVRLRTDCPFHDGEPMTAEDIAFTYRFLANTRLDDSEAAAPAPRYRGLVEAVDSIEVVHRDRVELRIDAGRPVGERALLVPILPAHVWRERAGGANGAGGATIAQRTAEAVATENVPPIGSGPFQFAERTEGEGLTLERFDGHFTLRSGVDLPAPTVDELTVRVDPPGAAAQRVVDDTADVTTSPLEANVVAGVDQSGSTRVLESPSWSFYCLGFNARDAPFSNPRFRRVIAQLIDKEWLVDEVFHGHARPVATPVTEEWTPESLEWNGTDPETPFLGTDGEVDEDAVEVAFESAGFRYDDRGRLRVRQ